MSSIFTRKDPRYERLQDALWWAYMGDKDQALVVLSDVCHKYVEGTLELDFYAD